MKHTPGPWYYHKRVDKTTGIEIAITQKSVPNNPKWDVARTYTEADAHLIVSAPDLLRACKVAYQALTIIEDYHKRERSNTTRMLNEAITKAERGA